MSTGDSKLTGTNTMSLFIRSTCRCLLDRRGSGDLYEAYRILLTYRRSLFMLFQADSFTGNENRSMVISSLITTHRGPLENKKVISMSGGAQQVKSKLSEQ